MRVLCAIGIRRGAELVKRVSGILRPGDDLVLVHVLDTGPRHDLNHLEGTLRPHHLQQEELDTAEHETGSEALKEASEEASRAGMHFTTRLVRGRPEHVIVSLAEEIEVNMVALFARERPRGHPVQGPPSVGHTARFIIDHAPVDVVVFRERLEG
ncbi:MAG: universal stress protein [Spirochaetia bacterium]